MDYDDTISSDTGEDYDKIHSIYSDIVKSSSETSVIKKIKKKSPIEKILTYLLNWKIVFVIFLIIILLFIIGGNEFLKNIIKTQKYNTYGSGMISFFIYCISLNMFIGFFTISFYF